MTVESAALASVIRELFLQTVAKNFKGDAVPADDKHFAAYIDFARRIPNECPRC